MQPPWSRARLRRRLGRWFFCWKRRLHWHFGQEKWAAKRDIPLPGSWMVWLSSLVSGYSRHNCIARRVTDRASGHLLREEPVTENHALMMYSPFLTAGE